MNERVASIEIQRKPIGELKRHPRHPREGPERDSPKWQILKRSLEFDYFKTMTWNQRNGCLVDGAFCVEVMRDMEPPVTHVDVSVVDYDEPTHYARMIAANRQLSEWIDTVLAALARDIELAGIDAALALYDHKALLALVEPPEIEDDTEQTVELIGKAEQLQQKWQIQPGDIWQLGAHRLLCGDCGDPSNHEALLPDGLADMIWCDPPYNVAYDQAQRKRNKITASKGRHYFREGDKATTWRVVSARLAGVASLIVTRSHAKIICLPTAAGDWFVLEGSANLRSSDNTEQLTIFNCPDLDAFHRSWLLSLPR